MWNFKGSLWNSIQNILPIHRKICIPYWYAKIRELIRLFERLTPTPMVYMGVKANCTMIGQRHASTPSHECTIAISWYNINKLYNDWRKHASTPSRVCTIAISWYNINKLYNDWPKACINTVSCVYYSHIMIQHKQTVQWLAKGMHHHRLMCVL